MDPLLKDIQSVLDSLLTRACKSTDLELEYKNDLDDFGAGQPSPERTQRHLEWFLLERSSDCLGGVPLEAFCLSESHAGIGDEVQAAECYAAMRASRVGVFMVSEVAPNEGILIDDMLGRGQYAVADSLLASLSANEGIAIGDLIVGRIYPHAYPTDGEKSTWTLSPSATTIRNDSLAVALDRDIQAMRARSRGPLRMSQLDLESMFFSEQIERSAPNEGADSIEPDLPSSNEMEGSLRERLSGSGISEEDVDEFVKLLRRTPMPEKQITTGGNDPVGWILDELAFESDIDLKEARKAISLLWQALDREARVSVKAPARAALSEEEESELSPANEAKRTEALARFDKGRDEGQDMDKLFQELEHELGIIDADEGEDSSRVPDFPGVLGALMQEFLWDQSRIADASLESQASKHKSLELFIQYGSFLGLAEELGREHIEIFLSRWLWEAGMGSGGEYDLSNLAASLGTFCQWLEEHHGHEIWKSSADLVEAASADLSRLSKLNQKLLEVERASEEAFRLFEYVGSPDSPDGKDRWQTDTGNTLEASAPAALEGEDLRSGDLLLGFVSDSELTACRVYPATAAPYLKATF
jgi:hypothetical protein